MILQALTRYYEDLAKEGKISKLGWSKVPVSFALCVNIEGDLEQVIPLLEDRGSKKSLPQLFDLPIPFKRTVGVKPNFICDNSSYMLGADSKGKPERSIDCFETSKEFHHKLLDGVDSEIARSILAFFDNWKPDETYSHPAIGSDIESILSGGNMMFRINGVYAYEDEKIRQAWQSFYDKTEGKTQQCLVSGSEDVIEPVHPSIKGVNGAQSSGAALVSFNASAFCSYGQEQNYNAPIGKHASFAYTSALNHMLSDYENVKRVGDTTIICWAEGAEPQYRSFIFTALFDDQSSDISESDLRNAVGKLARGLSVPERGLNPNRTFYILGLAPNAARLSVRFFYRDSFGNLMKNVNEHNERLEIVKPSYDQYDTIPIWRLVNETVNPNSREKVANPVMSGAVTRSVITGNMYPVSLLAQIVLRIRSERDINRFKAAIIKAYYLKNKNKDCPKEVLTVSLNEESKNVAYTLGRLFSIYEAIQEAANPGINATIKDKYFNTAASTPAVIFPILNNLSTKHLRKLSTGQRIMYEKKLISLAGILGEEYPSRMNLAQQGSFYLGYYHQTQKRYEKKEDK